MEKEINSPLRENKMGTKKIAPLLITMALPMIASMLVQALYNIVDSIYVSHYSDAALNALSLAFPVQNMMIGFATGIAVGVNALFSKSLGEHENERANRCAGNGIFLMICAVALFMLFGAFGTKLFYTVQTSDADVIAGGISYVSICCIFSLGIFAEVLFERLLQASGRTVHTMITQGTGAVLNIILDPLFINGYAPLGIPELGVAGAAIATVIGQWVAAILALIFNFKFNPDVKLRLHYLKPDGKILKPVLIVGIPTAVMMAISSVMNFGMNQIFQGMDETATNVFGIYYKLQSFFFMPIFGLNNATISIVAFNYGARNPGRIKKVLAFAVVIAIGIMTLGLLAFQIFPDQLLSIFAQGEHFAELGRSALRIISIHFPVAAVCIILGGCFQALGNGLYSTITSLCRQLIVLLPAAYLLSLTGQVNAVWWAFPVAEVASLLVTLFFIVRIWKKKIAPLQTQAA